MGKKKKEKIVDQHEENLSIKELEKEEKVQVWVKKSEIKYEKELKHLQIELLKFQNHVKEQGLKVLIVIEGRDAAGKGGTIKRITEHLNPRGARIVALAKPPIQNEHNGIFNVTHHTCLLLEKLSFLIDHGTTVQGLSL
jgi:polyphosphate kinase 2 (PPK2 family)